MNGYPTGRRSACSSFRFRKTPLAACVAASLVLSMAGPLTAHANEPLLVRNVHQQLLMHGRTSGNTVISRPEGRLGDMADAAIQRFLARQAPKVVTGATIPVSNCNNSGAGSLRTAVASATNNDTIDMSGLSCTINLASSIVTSVDNLTLQGNPSGKYPILDGGSSIVPLRHYGSGTLSIRDVSIYNGRLVNNSSVTRGGCVFSSGNIELVDSAVKYCTAENTAGGISYAQGGAIAGIGDITLSGSTVRGSTARNSGGGGANGGGIWSYGVVIIENESLIVDNSAEALVAARFASGGGVHAIGGEVNVLSGSTISDNTASSASFGANGAGIQASNVLVKYSTIERNLAVGASGFNSSGGGIVSVNDLIIKYGSIAGNEVDSGDNRSKGGGVIAGRDVRIARTTISGNTAATAGGLFLVGAGAGPALDISNSTISGNVATNSKSGAGLYAGRDTLIQNSTITGNIERNSGDDKYGAGLSVKGGVNVTLSSTIVSGNVLQLVSNATLPSDIGQAENGSGSATLSGDHNLFGWTTIARPADTIVTKEPGLGPLANNGGLTRTHALLVDSEAIDEGVANGFDDDQRGDGFPRVIGLSADIGAFESVGNDVIFADGFD